MTGLSELRAALAANNNGQVYVLIDALGRGVDPIAAVARRIADLYELCPDCGGTGKGGARPNRHTGECETCWDSEGLGLVLTEAAVSFTEKCPDDIEAKTALLRLAGWLLADQETSDGKET